MQMKQENWSTDHNAYLYWVGENRLEIGVSGNSWYYALMGPDRDPMKSSEAWGFPVEPAYIVPLDEGFGYGSPEEALNAFIIHSRYADDWDESRVDQVPQSLLDLKDAYPQFYASRKKAMRKKAMKNITYVLEWFEYPPDVTTEEWLGSDYYYRTLVKSVNEAERFNYHSDYWGDADEYQEDNIVLMEGLEPYIGERCYVEEGEDYIEGTLEGILIDNQYNSISHTCILFSDVTEEKTARKKAMRKRATFWNPTQEFLRYCDLEDHITPDKWNNANQQERDDMVRPLVQEYMRLYPDTNWGVLLDDLEDNNFHTPFRIFCEELGLRERTSRKKAMRKCATLDWQAVSGGYGLYECATPDYTFLMQEPAFAGEPYLLDVEEANGSNMVVDAEEFDSQDELEMFICDSFGVC